VDAPAARVAAGTNVRGTYDDDAASVASGAADIKHFDLSGVKDQVNRGLRDADARVQGEGTSLQEHVNAEGKRIKRYSHGGVVGSAVDSVFGGPGDGNENGGPPGGS